MNARLRRTSLFLITIATVAGFAPGQTTPDARSAPERVSRWREDIEYLARGLGARGSDGPSTLGQKDFEKLYPAPFFYGETKSIAAEIPNLTDGEIVLRLKRLLASAHVSHNDVQIPPGMGFFDRLPLTFAWYSDALAITGAAEQYAPANGARVVRIGSLTPEEVLAAISLYIPHENETWLRVQAPEFIRTRAVLEHLGLVGPDGQVSLTLERPGGTSFPMSVAPADPRTPRISVFQTLQVPAPLSRSQPDKLYWFQYLSDSQTLYIQYNACRDDPKLPFAEFARQALAEADAHPLKRVIVDLRQNSGGNSRVIAPLKSGLSARRKRIGRLYVLIGPITFSSGLLNAIELRNDLHANLVGERAGGTPNSYGEIKLLTLPNSRLVVRYTTKFFQNVKDVRSSTLDPDLPVPLTLADVLAGRDPVMAAALSQD